MDINELIENFELLEDWEDKYRYIIELGESLPPFPEAYKTEEWKVKGCQSQVWLVPEKREDKIYFIGDSDAAIVKGIVAIILSIFSGNTASKIKETAISDIFTKLGLTEHLSPSRRNGLTAMTEKIKHYAEVM